MLQILNGKEQEKDVRYEITVGYQGYTLNGKEQEKDMRYYITVRNQG